MNASEESRWVAWHHHYDAADSSLNRRLAMVQDFVRDALDAAAPGQPIRILSLCAGRGRDVIDVVAVHPRRADVVARLVELDPALGADAREAAHEAGLDHVDVVTGDASNTDAASGLGPAHLVLLCGIFGNISDADIRTTIEATPTLCAPGAVVVWTRHRGAPDFTATIREWFAASGFEEIAFGAPTDAPLVGVGAHRLIRKPPPFEAHVQLFTFVDDPSWS